MKLAQIGILASSGSSTPSYEPEAEAYFVRLASVGSAPSSQFKTDWNDAVLYLKNTGNWDKIRFLFIWAVEDRPHLRVDAKNPSATLADEVNSPTFTANIGLQGDGATQCVNTHVNLFTSGGVYTKNSGALFFYSRTNSNGFKADIGAFDSSGNRCAALDVRDGDLFYPNINDSGTTTGASNTDSRGFLMGERRNSTDEFAYRNGVSLGGATMVSKDPPDLEIYAMASNMDGSAAQFSNRQLSIIGACTGDTDRAELYNAFQNFAIARGFNV